MGNATILLLMNKDTPDDTVAELAEASTSSGGHLSCLIVGSGPSLSYSAYGIPPYGALNIPDNWGDEIEIAHQRQNQRVQEVKELLSRGDYSGDVQSAFCVSSEIRYHVARKACVSDVAYVAPNLRDTPEEWHEIAHGVLFQSPVGLMLNGRPEIQPKRVFVAWDGSTAAARAVHLALPYLKASEDVIIGCFDPVTMPGADGANPGSDVAAWLSHHRCRVTVSQFPSGGKEIALCIQDRARETGADLVVMGAYGHSRMLQAIFGGTTRTMTEQTEFPVFMAH